MRKYATIVADPPWPYTDGPTSRQRTRGDVSFLPYETMTLPQITDTLAGVNAAVDAHFYLWTTQRFLWDAERVARTAGYLPQQVLVWCKPGNGKGMGGAFGPNVEFCLFCRRNWGDALNLARAASGLTIPEVHSAVRGGGGNVLTYLWMKGERYPNERDWSSLGRLLGDFGPRAGLPKPSESSWFQWPRGEHSAKPDGFYDLVDAVSPGPKLEMFARRARFGWDYWGDQSLGTAEVAA